MGRCRITRALDPDDSSRDSPCNSANAERLRAGTHALIAGWGEIEYGQKKLTGELMWARSIVLGDQCKGASHFNSNGQICVTHPSGVASGVCFGDSGGPLLAAGPGGQGLVEIGITSRLDSSKVLDQGI